MSFASAWKIPWFRENFFILRDAKNFTGQFVVDEAILREEGMTDFSQYATVPGTTEFISFLNYDQF